MKCQKCKLNEATYHTSVTINGKTTEEHLCSECAQAEGKLPNFKSITIGEFFDSYADNYKKAKAPKAIICSGCGTLSTDFLSSGYVGCSRCYKSFENILRPIIKSIHGTTKHIGKLAAGTKNTKTENKQDEIERLKSLLKTAVDEERYEDAADLKKQIQKLSGISLANDGSDQNGNK